MARRQRRRDGKGLTARGRRRSSSVPWLKSRDRDRPRRRRTELIALITLLVATAVAYLWDLTASGYANSFYAAAVQAGTKSWKAFFFGSLDASNFITVDKPPASLWVMELSGRLFGFSSLSMLLPEALMGVATVALVYGAVRRWFGPRAAIVAGVAMATTPVAALMFRFNNPDALLVLLLTAAAYCLTRALERASTWWLLAVGVAVGFGFLAKMGEALLVVPGFACAYLLAAPAPQFATRPPAAGRRRRHGGQRGLVGTDRRPVAGRLPAHDRRLAYEQHLELDPRVQRPGPHSRQRRPGRRRGQFLRLRGGTATVQLADGRPGVVAAPGGPGRPDGGAPAHAQGAPDRSEQGRPGGVGRVARRGRGCVQPQSGCDPYLLHGGSRPSGGHARRDRRARASGNSATPSARCAAGALVSVTAAWAIVLLDRAPAWEPWFAP